MWPRNYQRLAADCHRNCHKQGLGGSVAAIEVKGEVYEIRLDLHATSNYFGPGHRIRIEVSSSNFPRWSRNLNTGMDNHTTIEWAIFMEGADMSETTLLESRVSKIEQDNRRLKLSLGALLLALAAIPLIGAVMPEQIPELIQARQFEMIHRDGTVRARMSVDGIGYADENGTPRVLMSDLGFSYWDENENLRLTMDADGFWYWDENGNVVWRSPGR
jgi:hypothetical protein